MSLQQNINNSIFSLTHLSHIKQHSDAVKINSEAIKTNSEVLEKSLNTKTKDPTKDRAFKGFVKDINMSDEGFQEALNNYPYGDYWGLSNIKKKPKNPEEAQQKANNAILAKQAEYEILRGDIPGRRRMDPMM